MEGAILRHHGIAQRGDSASRPNDATCIPYPRVSDEELGETSSISRWEKLVHEETERVVLLHKPLLGICSGLVFCRQGNMGGNHCRKPLHGDKIRDCK